MLKIPGAPEPGRKELPIDISLKALQSKRITPERVTAPVAAGKGAGTLPSNYPSAAP